MTILDLLILGVVQGLTEFLPISSSGHLVVFRHLLESHTFEQEGALVEVALHLGTLLSILIYYRQDVVSLVGLPFRKTAGPVDRDESMALLKWIILGSIPTVILGLSCKDWFEACFDMPVLVGGMLCVTGSLCLLTRFIPRGDVTLKQLGPIRSLCVGLAQGLAIIPGISRSGSTIVTALCMGVIPREAGRFSFLLSLPAVAGAAALKLKDLQGLESVSLPALGCGILASAVVGLLCLGLLTRILKAGNFFYFGFYCVPLGLFVIFYFI